VLLGTALKRKCYLLVGVSISVQFTVFWDVTPCSLLARRRGLGRDAIFFFRTMETADSSEKAVTYLQAEQRRILEDNKIFPYLHS
jgi:predicted nucleotidyltransferase